MFKKLLSRRLVQSHVFTYCRLSRWSALEKTFNSRPSTNIALVSKDVGLFNVPQLTTQEGFYNLTDKCLSKSSQLVDEALSPDRRRKMVEVFDELSDTLCQVADLAEFIRFAHPNSQYSKAAEHASISISGMVEELNTNVKLYEALKRAVRVKDVQDLNEVDKLVGDLFLFDFEQCGIHFSGEKREKVVDLNNRCLCLGQSFVNGISNPKTVSKSTLPDFIRDMFSTDGDRVVISGLYADSANPMIREMAYKIYLAYDSEQDQLLTSLLSYRNELANVCGFRTYAERALRGSILGDPANVAELLDAISDNIRTKAAADFEDMARAKYSSSLEIWDVPYFTRKAKKDRFAVTSKEYSPYFSLGACMEGLNIIFQSLYGVSLENAELASGEAWSKDVYKLAVVQDEDSAVLGYIYCDFYERNYKPNQDCHFTIKGGKVLPDGSYQLPIVVLMLNFPLPRWSSPTLLTPNMVDNLFHEMGHAMHSMLARTHYQHISGTRCSTDFAEVPSILMEYFASDPRVLKLFAKHFQTKEPISEAMLERLCASKRLYTASETQLQVFYAALDQNYHGTHPLAGTTTEVLARCQERYYGLPYVPNTNWHLRFSHLVGYGAKYYSYLVSRAIVNLIWRTYFKDDPLNRSQGDKYRNECLAFGGGKNPRKLVADFLQLEPSPRLLAKSLSDELEEHQCQVGELGKRLRTG